MLVASYYISASGIVPEEFIYYSSLSVMPEGLSFKLDEIKNGLYLRLGVLENNRISQKGGSINDLIKSRNLSDLSVTPSDITKNTEKLMDEFREKGYDYDGVVIERTFTAQQATDSFENVHVRNVTADSVIDIERILSSDFSLPAENVTEPLVLIYHTHSTESYIPTDNGEFSSAYPTRNDDKNANMIRVGEELCAILEANGIGTVHDMNIYDEQYTGAYDKSREGVEKLLKKYPSIIITLDIHRDAVYYDDYTRVKPVVEINGVKAAQMMIIAGAEGGNVASFPDWKTNLSFALRLQRTVNNEYESLMKPVYFCNRKYNMDITPYSLLVEVGTDVNTLEEAAYSARLLGAALSKLIKENVKNE